MKSMRTKSVMFIPVLALLVLGILAGPALAATVPNGDFELGNTDFSSSYTYVPPGSGGMWYEGRYAIGGDPNAYHDHWTHGPTPHGGSSMMIVNGSTTPGTNVWRANVSGLLPDHVYTLEFWAASLIDQKPATLLLAADNEISGTAFGVGTTLGTAGGWAKISGTVVIPAGVTEGTFYINNEEVAHSGNDFAIDDIRLIDEGSTTGKTTGGIKFMDGSTEVQLEFVAMAKDGSAKGNVNYKASNGNEFMGKVTGYRQGTTTACFVGEITKTNVEGWTNFYVAVSDNGEGILAAPDEGVRVLAGPNLYEPSLALATEHYEAFTGNVQIH